MMHVHKIIEHFGGTINPFSVGMKKVEGGIPKNRYYCFDSMELVFNNLW